MSDILSSMTAYLLTSSELTALIGDRLKPMRIPAGSTSNPTPMPYVTYQLIDEPLRKTHDRKMWYQARVQVDAWADSYKSAHAVGDVLFMLLDNFDGSWSPFRIMDVTRVSKSDDPGMPDAGLERLVQDFIISYAEEG